jgi:hypothetical protein
MKHDIGEYPRPQLMRGERSWKSLNGQWEFAFDDEDRGRTGRWFAVDGEPLPLNINVPFCYQSRMSGIGDPAHHDILWYRKKFRFDGCADGDHVVLHFGAVDYEAEIWLNGIFIGRHSGGHSSFSFEVGDALSSGDNLLVLRVRDYSADPSIPRGKQYWKERPDSIFYTGTSGIWQNVWLERLPEVHVKGLRFTPDIDRDEIGIEIGLEGFKPGQKIEARLEIRFGDDTICLDSLQLHSPRIRRSVALGDYNDHGEGRWWSPENPNLYSLTLRLVQGDEELDRVESYFGMRKVSVINGQFCLNNRPYYMRLVLDQGYYPDSLMTPPDAEAIRSDVELIKAMGFNGIRRHQSVADPRFLSCCDREGLLVWEEAPAAHKFSGEMVQRFLREWMEIVERDINHPCIAVWVPFNESWGVSNIVKDLSQRSLTEGAYHLTVAMDPSRCVLSNDGWEHTRSDLCTIHDYTPEPERIRTRYASVDSALAPLHPGPGRFIMVPGFDYGGEPCILSEFGGISFRTGEREGWGYSSAADPEDFRLRLEGLFSAVYASPVLQGFCYTQFTDVEQEINGLLTARREPKSDLETIRRIVLGT